MMPRLRIGRRDDWCDRRLLRTGPQENDGRHRRAEEPRRFRGDVRDRHGIGRCGNHDCERLRGASLPDPQKAHRRLVAGVDEQLKPAQAFESDDLPASQRLGSIAECLMPDRQNVSRRIPQRKLRPAVRAGIRFGMKAAGVGIIVFGLTDRAHRKAPHGRAGPVVRDGRDDAVTRAAMTASRERIAVTAIIRIEDFAKALGAGCEIGEDDSRTLVRIGARRNHESPLGPVRLKPKNLPIINAGRRPDLGIEPSEKPVERLLRAFYFQRHALAGIADKASKPLARQRADERRGGIPPPALYRSRQVEVASAAPALQ